MGPTVACTLCACVCVWCEGVQLARIAKLRKAAHDEEEPLCERLTDIVDTIIEMDAFADELA